MALTATWSVGRMSRRGGRLVAVDGVTVMRRFESWHWPRMCRFGRIRAAVLVVVLVEVGLFAVQHWDQWRNGLVRVGTQQTLAGEGLVVRGDGLGYYAWLRSALIDHDWSFDNEFDDHNPMRQAVPAPGVRTDLGRRQPLVCRAGLRVVADGDSGPLGGTRVAALGFPMAGRRLFAALPASGRRHHPPGLLSGARVPVRRLPALRPPGAGRAGGDTHDFRDNISIL